MYCFVITMKSLIKNRRGNISAGGFAGVMGLASLALVFVVFGVVTTYGADITSELQDDFTANTYEYNISENSLEGMAEVSAKVPTIAKVVVGALIISILVSAFAGILVMRR